MIESKILSYGFSHHLFHQAKELHHRFEGYRAATGSYISDSTVKRARKISPKLSTLLSRRSLQGLPSSVFKTYPSEQLLQIACRILGRPYSFFAAHDRNAHRILRDFSPPEVLIAVDTGAESLFKAWSPSVKRVLDLTIAVPQYRQKIFSDAAQTAQHQGVEFHMPGEWEMRRYAAEIELADHILCPSEFVRDSCIFLGADAQKLHLLPYGFDPGRFRPRSSERSPEAPLRFVFGGTFCHRKGSHILTKAFEQLVRRHPSSELHVFGEVMDTPPKPITNMTLHGRVPQGQLAQEFRSADALVFPTLFEGSAYVVYQALASGLPVITTRNCGSVVDETCGYLLPDISVETTALAMERVAANRLEWREKRVAATERAGQYSWKHYGDRLEKLIRQITTKD